MSHEVETMAFANQLPWHGLGNRVDDCISVDDMIVAAGIDWEVKQAPCYATVDGEKITVPRQVLYRETDKRILTVTGDNWLPLQNKDAAEFFRDWTEAGGAKLETMGSLRGGKVIWGLAKIAAGFTLKGRDKVEGYVLLVSPHECGKAITVRGTMTRVVCANTMAVALRDAATYTQSHLKEFDHAAAKEAVALVTEKVREFELDAGTLMKLKMSEFDNVRLLAKFFQPIEAGVSEKEDAAQVQALIDNPASQNKVLQQVLLSHAKAPGATPGNGWGTLNAVTHWADHVAGREADARMFRSWFGHTGRIKEQVKTDLLEMAA